MNRFIISILIFTACCISGCSKFLDRQPTDFVSPNQYYSSEEELNSALSAVYDILGHNNLYAYRMLLLNGLEGDDGYYARASATGTQVHSFSTSNNEVAVCWGILYIGIARANNLLVNIDNNPDVNDEARSVIRGEALFLRAYYHFLLTQLYGDIPLFTAPVASANDVNTPAAPSRDVYNQIIEDMTAAEALVLPVNGAGFSGRVTKSAVRGILARVCLQMAGNPVNDITKYAEARKWAKMVIDDAEAGHALNPDFSQIFINMAQDIYETKESIWEVEFWGNATGGYNETGYVGAVNGPRSTNVLTGTGFGGIRGTSRLYDLFDEADQRKYWSLARFTYNATGANGSKTFFEVSTVQRKYTLDCGKFRREYELLAPKANNVGPHNFPLLRFSDVLLMYAEAENEINGPTTEAVEAVNRLRKARWSSGIRSVAITSAGSGYTSAPTVTFSGGGGSGAQATAVVSAGRVNQIIFADDAVTGRKYGHSYSSFPTITLSGGGGTGAAAEVTAINRIEDAAIPAANTLSKDAFREFIQDERSRELCFEGMRKHDLIRWGIFVERMHTIADMLQAQSPTNYAQEYYRNVDERHLLWPIPALELSLNLALTQNPGW